MTGRAKIARAAQATDAILEHWQRSREVLETFMINGFGVHADPGSLKLDLAIVAERIAKAQAIARETEWPAPEDYDAEEN